MKFKYILGLCLFLFLVSTISVIATPVTDIAGTYITKTTLTNYDGMKILVTGSRNLLLGNLTLNTTSPSQYVQVYFYNNLSLYKNMSVTGYSAYMNITLLAGTSYYVVSYNPSGSIPYNCGVTYPILGTNINWTSGTSSATPAGLTAGEDSTCIRDIYSITTDNLAPGAITFNPPSESGVTKYLPSNYILVNYTLNITGLNNSTLYLYNSTQLIQKIDTTNTTVFVNFTVPFTNDTYYYNVTARNTTNQSITSLTYTNNILLLNSTSYINFTFPSESNITKYIPSNYILVNVSVNTSNFPSMTNMTIYLYNSTQLIQQIDTINTTVFVNFTIPFTNDTYYYNVTIRRIDGIINSLTYTNYIRVGFINVSLINFSFNRGFNASLVSNASFSCSGDPSNITALVVFNNVTIFNGTANNSVIYSNVTVPLRDGYNFLRVNCSNGVGTISNLMFSNFYIKSLCLINEQTNTLFNSSNLSSTRVYYDDNSSYYDYKLSGVSCINFTDNIYSKLRFSLGYVGGSVITRYVDISLINSSNVRVCANPDPTNYYEQLIVSASLSPIIMSNVFSNCLVAADYTRFAYQDGLVLKAYTINSLYSFYNFVNGVQTIVASIDGSIATYINLDTLLFSQKSNDITLASDSLSFHVFDNNTIEIYYSNLAGDNTNISVNIIRLDTGGNVYSSSNFINPNEFTLLFDHSAVPGANETTIFAITVSLTKSDGRSDFIKRYFNIGGHSGTTPANFAMFISILLFMFGLTFAAQRITFSWFGIFVCIASMVVLAFCINTWYTLLIMFMEFVVLLFLILNMIFSSSGSRTVES